LNQLFTSVLIAPNQDIFLHRHKNQTTNQLQLLRFLKPAESLNSQNSRFTKIRKITSKSHATKIWVFARKFWSSLDLEIRPIRGSVIFDGHVRRWYRLSIVPLVIFMGSNFIGRKDERIWLDEKEKDESDETVRWLSDDMRMNQSENRRNKENYKLI